MYFVCLKEYIPFSLLYMNLWIKNCSIEASYIVFFYYKYLLLDLSSVSDLGEMGTELLC